MRLGGADGLGLLPLVRPCFCWEHRWCFLQRSWEEVPVRIQNCMVEDKVEVLLLEPVVVVGRRLKARCEVQTVVFGEVVALAELVVHFA